MCILKIYVDAMGSVVTPLRSVTFLDDQTTSKSMQEKLNDGQYHKTNLEQDMKHYCTQHNCQQFEQQGPFSVEDMPVEGVPSLKLGPLPDHIEISCLDAHSLPVPGSTCNCLLNPFIHPALLVIGQASHWNIWPHPSALLLFLLDCSMQGKYSFDSLRFLLLGALHDSLLVLIWHCVHGRHRWCMLHLLSTL